MRTRTAGIGVEDLAWIHRDQFLHYLTVTRTTGDPTDWPRFRDAVVEALEAAFGLAPEEAGPAGAFAVVEGVRRTHDPANDWEGFLDELWRQRRSIRPDLD